MGVERDRPQHRMHDDEHDADGAEPEPQQRQRQQRDRRQRIEHRGQGRQKVGADAGRDRKRGEHAGGDKPDRIAHAEHAQRSQRAVDQHAVHGGIPERRERVAERREQQRIVENARVNLPGGGEHGNHDQAPHQRHVGEPLDECQRARDVADRADRFRRELPLRTQRRQRASRAVIHDAPRWRARFRSGRRTASHECGG